MHGVVKFRSLEFPTVVRDRVEDSVIVFLYKDGPECLFRYIGFDRIRLITIGLF